MATKPPLRVLPPLSDAERRAIAADAEAERAPAAPAPAKPEPAAAVPAVRPAEPEPPALPLGPALLPEALSPMFPGGASEPFSSADHLFEVRWDGLRALAF